MELRLTLRNGENLLVTFGIPLGLLVFLARVDVVPRAPGDPLAFLVPGVLALSVMSSAMVALAIATGFERSWLVLKRLGATPLRRGELIAAKSLAVLAILAVQVVAVLAVATGVLGYRPGAGALWLVPVALGLGTAAFAGLGLAMAGGLPASTTLALANGLYVVLLLVSGLVFPLDRLPGWLAARRRGPARRGARRPAARGSRRRGCGRGGDRPRGPGGLGGRRRRAGRARLPLGVRRGPGPGGPSPEPGRSGRTGCLP